MDPLQGVVLGVVQGLAEPLPISSSAHLILAPWLLGWQDQGLTFDVALHMGTLAALLLYFWRDWWSLVTAWLPARAGAEDRRALDRRLGIGIVIGTVPAAIAGILFDDVIERSLREPTLIAVVMAVATLVIFAADRLGRRTLELEAVTWSRALVVGLAQAVALAPGVSRSGITISAGLFLGLTREAAARYSFLLAAPVTTAAGILKLKDLAETGIPAGEQAAFAAGVLTSFVVGLFAIGVLLRYLRRYSLAVFVIYRALLVALIFGVAAVRGA
jgi:undecaprenyl-diphosphatase